MKSRPNLQNAKFYDHAETFYIENKSVSVGPFDFAVDHFTQSSVETNFGVLLDDPDRVRLGELQKTQTSVATKHNIPLCHSPVLVVILLTGSSIIFSLVFVLTPKLSNSPMFLRLGSTGSR